MEDNINLLMANFEDGLEQLLGNSGLPIGVAYYILKAKTDKLFQDYIGFINGCYMKQAEEHKELQEQETENNKVE